MALSKHVRNLKPSPTLALAAKAIELKKAGKDVISLTVGEPDWETYPHIKAKGIEAIEKNHTKYTAASGIVELRQAIADQFVGWYKVPVKPEHVTVTGGAKFILFAALQTLLDPGNEIIIPLPYWVSYPTMAELCDAKVVTIDTDSASRFKVTAQQLKQAITPRTKVFLFNSPSNPTGMTYTLQELEDMAEVLKENPRVYVVSDDIYNQLNFTTGSRSPHLLDVAPELFDRVVSVNGVSKAYAMTGWRIGWAVGNKEIISGMANYQSQALGSTSSISQDAAVAALLSSDSFIQEVGHRLKIRCEAALKGLNQVAGLVTYSPDAAFYLWSDVRAFVGKQFKGTVITDSRAFSELLLQEKNVVVVPGQEFGVDGYIRMSFALEEPAFAEAAKRIKEFCESLGRAS